MEDKSRRCYRKKLKYQDALPNALLVADKTEKNIIEFVHGNNTPSNCVQIIEEKISQRVSCFVRLNFQLLRTAANSS